MSCFVALLMILKHVYVANLLHSCYSYAECLEGHDLRFFALAQGSSFFGLEVFNSWNFVLVDHGWDVPSISIICISISSKIGIDFTYNS